MTRAQRKRFASVVHWPRRRSLMRLDVGVLELDGPRVVLWDASGAKLASAPAREVQVRRANAACFWLTVDGERWRIQGHSPRKHEREEIQRLAKTRGALLVPPCPPGMTEKQYRRAMAVPRKRIALWPQCWYAVMTSAGADVRAGRAVQQ